MFQTLSLSFQERVVDAFVILTYLFYASFIVLGGMNLENTTDVIFYHKTETVMYKQVIGRAQRPGRTSCLNVHNLLYLQE